MYIFDLNEQKRLQYQVDKQAQESPVIKKNLTDNMYTMVGTTYFGANIFIVQVT